MDKIKSRNRWLLAGMLVLIALVLMLAWWNQNFFSSDEEEIFLKGRALTQGMLLYRDVGSQHMPLMYYIAALFSLCGARSVADFRFCFYLLMAVLWGVMYLRYSKTFGRKALILYPLIYIMFASMIEFGYTVLSEQLQGIGMVILLFELLTYVETRSIRIGNCVMISLAVLISFGSAFMAVFAIFFVFLIVFFSETRICHENKTGFFGMIWHMIKKYWLLIVIVALPFAVLIGYYIATGTFDEFYDWAYLINRYVYPKYNTSYTGGIAFSMFGGFSKLGAVFGRLAFNVSSLAAIGSLLICVLLMVKLYQKYHDIILTVGLPFFFAACATRGYNDFHGLPAIAVASAMMALYLPDVIEKLRASGSALKKGVAIFCVVLFCSSYMKVFPNLFSFSFADRYHSATAEALDLITDENEKVGISALNNDILLEAGVIPASVSGGSCPWMWEFGRERAMEMIEEEQPRVFLYYDDITTWGYKITDYAPELVEYVHSNYTSLTEQGYDILYVRNDYLDEALSLLAAKEA